MCFSATASFVASGALLGAGLLTYRAATSENEQRLAIFPALFGLQQAAEGMVWLGFSNPGMSGAAEVAKYIFLLVAWVGWPVLVPFIYRPYTGNKRMRFMNGMLLTLGTLTGVLNLWTLSTIPVTANIDVHHVRYLLKYERMLPVISGIVYVAVTLLPAFLTLNRNLFIVAAVQTGAFLMSYFLMREALVSVWCFMAAVSSITLLWFVLMNRKKAHKA